MRSLLVGALLTLLSSATVLAKTSERSGSLEGVRADIRLKRFAPALDTLLRLAQNGDSHAQYLLACALLNGIAAEPNEAEGLRWLKAASEGGQPAAMFVLASILSRSIPADQAQVSALLARAAAAGNTPAQDVLKRGTLLAPDRAASLRDPDSRRQLVLWAIRHNEAPLLSSLAPLGEIRDDFGTTAVGVAAQSGALDSLHVLLCLGFSVNEPSHYGITPLMLSAGSNQAGAMEALLAAGADLTKVDAAGNGALTYAARADSAALTEMLLAHDASPATLNKAGHTVLDEALALDAVQAAAVLRARGAPGGTIASGTGIDHAADYSRAGALYKGWSPLLVAVSRDDTTAVTRLMDTSNAPAGALAVAVQSGAIKSAALLLAHGADAGTPDARGTTPLNAAVRQRDRAMVNELLGAGANADQHARAEPPPLVSATLLGEESIVASLLAAHARVDATDERGHTALLVASGQGRANLVRALLAAGAEVAHEDATGRSALWLASNGGHAEVVQLLLGAHAALGGHDHLGVTALMAASAQGHETAMAALLAVGADRAARSSDGNTALILAAGAGRVAAVKLLIASPESVNAQNSLGDTALMAASRFGHLEACRVLVRAGADASLRNTSRQTAADIARARGLANIQTLLDAA